MKPEDHAAQATPRGEQLLFDWTQAENVQANQQVTREAGEPAEASREPDATAAPCPLTATESGELESHSAGAAEGHGFAPGHPWHYIRRGDNAPPVPFDDIPPAEDYGRSLERELPKPAAKRIIKARQILEAERRSLEQARARYEDVIARGAEALSRYDREIAYGGNDELARAGTLALLFNQISWRRGRIAYLEQLQSRPLARTR